MSKKWCCLSRLALVFGVICLASVSTRAEPTVATLLFASNMPEISAKDGGGGLAELTTVLAGERQGGRMVVFLHGGDSLGPSVLGSFDHGAHMIDILNTLKPDAMALAGHELIYGEDALARNIRGAWFPFLSANLADSESGGSIEGVKGSVLVDVGSYRLGILAVASPELTTEYLVQRIEAGDPYSAIEETTRGLRAEGADLIVAMLDFEPPDAKALRTQSGIDILLVAQPEANRVMADDAGIVAALGGTSHLVALDLQLENVSPNEKGETFQWSANTRLLALSGQHPDPAMAARIDTYVGSLSNLLVTRIGATTVAMDTSRNAVRTRENAFGNFVADILREEMTGDVALINGGSIRGGRTYAPGTALTWGDIRKELPFGNHPVLLEVSGRQLHAALENGLGRIEDAKGRFPHISNMTVTYDPAYPRGQRILHLEVDGKPVDSEATYKLATISYLANGGDDYVMLKEAPRLVPAVLSKFVWKLVSDTIAGSGEISPAIEGRLTVETGPPLAPVATAKIDLTAEERAWLAGHRTVRLAPDPDFAPIEFFDENGAYMGLAADLVRMVAERVGLRLEVVRQENWNAVLEALQSGDVDMSAAMPQDEENSAYLNFTRPYDEFPSVIITRTDVTGSVTVDQLSGQKIAVVSGWPEEAWLRESHPDVEVVAVSDTVAGLDKVAFGDMPAMVSFLPTASYYITKRGMTNLRVAGGTGLMFPDAFAVRKDWPELIGILQKGLDTVTDAEHLEILQRWIQVGAPESGAPKVQLTPEEKSWLAGHRTIRIGGDATYPPFEFVDTGATHRGIAVDYLDVIGERLGITFEFVPGLSWGQVVAGLREKTLDLTPVMTPTKERRKLFAFTQRYLNYPQVIVTRKDYPPVTSIEDFNDKTVAASRDYSEVAEIRRHFPDVDLLVVDNPLEELRAVSAGKADGLSGNLAVLRYLVDKHNLVNLEVAGPSDVEGGAMGMGVRGDWPELARLIDRAIDSMTPEEHKAIRERWVSMSAEDAVPVVELTSEERKWLREHEPLRLGTDPDWPPIDFVGVDGTYQGIASEYVRLLAQRLDVEIELVGKKSWTDTIDRMKKRDLDIVSTVSETAERLEFMNFTKPFIRFPIVIITRDDAPFVGDVKELDGRTVAVVEEYRAHIKLRENHPGIDLLVVGSLAKGLKAVSSGRAFAFVDNLATATNVIQKEGITNLKVAAPTPYANSQAIGVRKDIPELVPLLEKGLAAITEAERTRIYNKWISMRFEHAVDYTLIWKIIGGFAAVVVVILFWTNQIRRQREAIKMSGERLELALEGGDLGSWDLDLTNRKTVVNERWAEILGYSLGEIEDAREIWRQTIHPGDHDRIIEAGRAYREGETQMYEVEYRAITKQGDERWLISKGAIVGRDDKGQPLRMVGTVMDVTESKEAERKLADAFNVIHSSIEYASNIQRSILPPDDGFSLAFDDHFVIWEPRDVVGGDIYWNRKWGEGTLVVLVDCTGHGVPGAFMTMIATGSLDRAQEEVAPGEVGKLVHRMHQFVQTTLGQHEEGGHSDDGLELGACYLEPDKAKLTFCGARFELYSVRNGEVAQLKGTRKGMGYRGIPVDQEYDETTIEVIPGTKFYMTTDGLIDQVGGEKRRSFGKKRFGELLLSVKDLPMAAQKERVLQSLTEYQGEEIRRDDVSIIGFRIE